jgi:signal transduction histidine kinase
MLGIRHEERRLLRRELHDGLGPALAGSSLALAAIANNSRGMSARDAELIVQLRAELDRRADDVRDMARAMLPPALDDGRLHAALEVLAERFTDDRFAVSLDATGADDIDSDRQVAIYHVAAEAVFNAHRHSGAATCRLRLRPTAEGGRQLSVHDDGSGISPVAAEGVGLASMRERALELGGTFDLVHDEGGTTLTVVFP